MKSTLSLLALTVFTAASSLASGISDADAALWAKTQEKALEQPEVAAAHAETLKLYIAAQAAEAKFHEARRIAATRLNPELSARIERAKEEARKANPAFPGAEALSSEELQIFIKEDQRRQYENLDAAPKGEDPRMPAIRAKIAAAVAAREQAEIRKLKEQAIREKAQYKAPVPPPAPATPAPVKQ